MSHTGLPHDAVFYPTSDGQPMAETAIHRRCMVDVADTLELWFRKHGRDDVYVGSNNFLYYERGNPRAVVAPDVYVVVGAPAYPLRDTYMLWKEPKAPDFVLEVTSASTRRNDERRKRDVYAALGVREYFLYDPRAEYLTPPLQGWRLHEGAYRAMPAVTVLSNRGVAVASEVLGLELRDARDARMLRLRDPATGEVLLTHEESERARAQAEQTCEEAERARKEEAAARRAAEGRAVEEAQARRAAEARAAEEAQARRATEARAAEEAQARRATEARAAEEAQARRAAETRAAELEARLRALADTSESQGRRR